MDTYSLKELVKTSLFKDLIINQQLQQKLSKLINEKLYQFRHSLHQGSDIANSVGFNHDGTKVYIMLTIHVCMFIQRCTYRQIERYTSSIQSVAFNHDGTKIVSVSYDETSRLWNVDMVNVLSHWKVIIKSTHLDLIMMVQRLYLVRGIKQYVYGMWILVNVLH